MTKIVAMIPARMGSKRIPKKNIRLLNGKPLIQYAIDAAKEADCFDEIWDRWALYWEIYPKAHIELVDDSLYTYYSENFNSGYGSLNHLLSCPLKELGVFGFTFYNFGVVRNMKDKYNSEYIKSLGSDGTYLGPDKVLHDQISQIMHCKNVLEKDPRFVLDPDIRSQMYTKSITERIEKFKKLPKFKQETE